MHRPERTKWKLVLDRFRPPADLSRRGPQIMPALGAHVHSDAICNALCGAEETRTPDFLLAKEALYQLSYGPKTGYAGFGAAASSRASVSERASDAGWAPRGEAALSVAPTYVSEYRTCRQPSRVRAAVGASGLEPETSALSGQCSNQLS